MGNIWFYRSLFVLLVIAGIIIRAPNLVRLALVKGGIEGLLIDEKLAKEKFDFEQQKLLLELEQLAKTTVRRQANNVEAFRGCRDLTLPADPDEGY